jgi:hypothetical protein
MRCRTLAALTFLAVLSVLPAAADSVEATQVIGMGLKSVISAFGLPQNMFTFRGSEEARDDVVFYYPDHMYLFWFKDRVWQVRFDRRATVVFHGVSLGMNRSEVEAVVAERPLVASGDSLYFDLGAESFPVRVRLVFAGTAVSDIYVYRSDY